jgi:hypothetical protein
MTVLAAVVFSGAIPSTLLHDHFRAFAWAANCIGLTASALMLLYGRLLSPSQRDQGRRAQTADRSAAGEALPASPGPVPRVHTAHSDDTEPDHVEPGHADDSEGAPNNSLLFDFYTGIQFNPRLGPLDLKVRMSLWGGDTEWRGAQDMDFFAQIDGGPFQSLSSQPSALLVSVFNSVTPHPSAVRCGSTWWAPSCCISCC